MEEERQRREPLPGHRQDRSLCASLPRAPLRGVRDPEPVHETRLKFCPAGKGLLGQSLIPGRGLLHACCPPLLPAGQRTGAGARAGAMPAAGPRCPPQRMVRGRDAARPFLSQQFGSNRPRVRATETSRLFPYKLRFGPPGCPSCRGAKPRKHLLIHRLQTGSCILINKRKELSFLPPCSGRK